jgi:hypothetical protein
MRGGIASLAKVLGVTPRRTRELEDEGIIVRHPDDSFDEAECVRRYRLYADRDIETVADEAERLLEQIEAGFRRMEAVRGLEERRRIGKQFAPAIGRFDRALRLANSMMPVHARPLLNTCTDVSSGRFVARYLELTGQQLRDDD